MRFFAFFVVLAVTAPAHADDKHRVSRWIVAGSVEVALGLTTDVGSPDHCRWCDPTGLDESVRRHVVWDDRQRAKTLSNITAPAVGVSAVALLLISAREAPCLWRRFGEDALPIFEAYAYTELITRLVKISVARERPDVHFRDLPDSPENNLSFYSGHSSIAFSLAVAAGIGAQRRHYKLAPAVWASGLALAATTAYLRIAGDRHYFTDVATGALVGSAGGYVIPTLLEGRDLAIVPARSGVALAGAF